MEILLNFISSLAPVVQIIVCLFLIVIFRKELAALIKKAVGLKEDEANKQEKVPIWAQTLIGHFNHETTDNQGRLEQGLEALHAKQDAVIKSLDKLCDNVDEIRLNGIRVRN